MLIWTPASPIGLDVEFYLDVNALLGPSQWSWYVTAGCRSIVEQRVLYRKHLEGGPLAAVPGKSAHNALAPSLGCYAIDVALDGSPKPGLQMLWNTKHAGWIWLIQAVFRHPRLHSLWRVGDWPHIQSTLWKGGRYASSPDFLKLATGRPIVTRAWLDAQKAMS